MVALFVNIGGMGEAKTREYIFDNTIFTNRFSKSYIAIPE